MGGRVITRVRWIVCVGGGGGKQDQIGPDETHAQSKKRSRSYFSCTSTNLCLLPPVCVKGGVGGSRR